MRFLNFIFIFAIALTGVVGTAFTEEDVASNENTVDDESKTSSRSDNMFKDVETIGKAMDIAEGVQTGKQAWDALSGIKNFEDFKALTIDQAAQSLQQMVFKYKNTKAGFLKDLFELATKVTKVLDGASKKLNEWNTTYPSLIAFRNSALKMLDNSVEVFNDFKWSDLYDIDRKWDRRLEANLAGYPRTFFMFSKYLENRYYSVNNSNSNAAMRQNFERLFMPYEITTDVNYTTVLATADRHRMLPFDALYNCAEALSLTAQIEADAHGNDVDGNTGDQKKLADIEAALQNNNRTMEDERQLQGLITLARQSVAIKTTNLQQMQTSLEQKYARLLMREVEINALESQSYYNNIDTMIQGGSTASATTLNDYRNRLLSVE